MTIKEMRQQLGDTQLNFSQRYGIPFRTIQNWESGSRIPPVYVEMLLEQRVRADLANRRTTKLPKYDSSKRNLPRRSDFSGVRPWLRAVADVLGENTVFALDNALMCEESFLGRSDEFLVWIYGDDSLTQYNGVVVLGNRINPLDITETAGLRHTVFHRTLEDAMANENILDMQGITEALSNYYFTHCESFSGLALSPVNQEKFEKIAEDAINYYSD